MFKMNRNKNDLKESLFERALNWYISESSDLKSAALELFPEDQLEREVEHHRRRKEKEMREKRENVLKEKLEECKKTFPVGTLVWSDEGTDHLPNLIISEPYIGTTKYENHVPYGAYEYGVESSEQKTVLAKTIRLSRGEFNGENFYRSIVGLEKCIENMNRSDQWKKNHIIDLDKYCQDELNKKENEILKLQEKIRDTQKRLIECQLELANLESYDPTKLTKERVAELVKKWAV